MNQSPDDKLIDELLRQSKKPRPTELPFELEPKQSRFSPKFVWVAAPGLAAVATVGFLVFQTSVKDLNKSRAQYPQTAQLENASTAPSIVAMDTPVPSPEQDVFSRSRRPAKKRLPTSSELRDIAGSRTDFGDFSAAEPSPVPTVMTADELAALDSEGLEDTFATLDSGARELESVRTNPAPPPLSKPLQAVTNSSPLTDPTWKAPKSDPLSTFSIDVDTASYTTFRRNKQSGYAIHPDSVRAEEWVNYFDYNYRKPTGDDAFAFDTKLAPCPWEPKHVLARIAIQGKEISRANRPASNLTFLLDVSGSMSDPQKLPLLQRSMVLLLEQLDERDTVSIIVYAGSEGVVLPPTKIDAAGRITAIRAVEELRSSGSTNGQAGIQLAYEFAKEHFKEDGTNRVILATDGDFNVGTTDPASLVEIVKAQSENGLFLSVLGLGSGMFNDALLETLSNDGNGNYFFIDNDREARKVFQKELAGTLVTIAKDVKLQIEFNPARVSHYRLLGYANRELAAEDFNDDKVDAGDIGAGHQVTAFYEIVPSGVKSSVVPNVDALKYQQTSKPDAEVKEKSKDWFTLKLRHKLPNADKSTLLEQAVDQDPATAADDPDFSFATAVLATALKYRGSEGLDDFSWDAVSQLASEGRANSSERAEFTRLISHE